MFLRICIIHTKLSYQDDHTPFNDSHSLAFYPLYRISRLISLTIFLFSTTLASLIHHTLYGVQGKVTLIPYIPGLEFFVADSAITTTDLGRTTSLLLFPSLMLSFSLCLNPHTSHGWEGEVRHGGGE
jgi:hypothetical protein